MTISNDQLGARVDKIELRLTSVEKHLETVATKDDISCVLQAIAAVKADTAGPVEAWKTGGSLAKFVKWFAGLGGAVLGFWYAATQIWPGR